MKSWTAFSPLSLKWSEAGSNLLYLPCQYELIYLCCLSFQRHRETPSKGHKEIFPVCSGHINLCQINKERGKKRGQTTENDKVSYA